MAKPFGVCWCDCHMPVDEEGRRAGGEIKNDAGHVNGWPRYDEPIALATACPACRVDHSRFLLSAPVVEGIR